MIRLSRHEPVCFIRRRFEIYFSQSDDDLGGWGVKNFRKVFAGGGVRNIYFVGAILLGGGGGHVI